MEYRRFGRTNLRMPVLSCGGMRYQHKWQDMPLEQIPAESQANLEATIRRAVSLGINHIETARGYGTSERQLGQVLPTFPRDRLIVQTKVTPEKDAEAFGKKVEESLERLRLSYVDLLGIHGLNNEETVEWALRDGGCLAVARRLQKRGLVRHVGFSTHAPTHLILKAIRHEGDGGFDYINLHWYWIFQKNWPAIDEATRRDMGVFIISPSDKGGKLYEPSAKLVELCRPLHPIAFNDLWCLSHPQVHTLSIGAARPTDFDAHVAALEQLGRAREVTAPIAERLTAELAKVPARLRDPFTLNLPDWEHTPGQINIPVILWLRTLVKALDMVGYGQMRYNLLGNGGHWFPGQNAAKVEEVDLRAIAERSGLAGEDLVGLLKEAHGLLWKEPVKRISET